MNKELTLWSLTNEHRELLSRLYDYETGEVNEEVQAQINALEPDITDKCIAVNKWISKLEKDQLALEKLEEEVKLRKEAFKKEIKFYKEYLQKGMEENNIMSITCPYFTIKLIKNPTSTEIIDESLLPEQFFNYKEIIKTEKKPDKVKIKEHVLRTQEQVPGAHVGQKNRVEVLIDKI